MEHSVLVLALADLLMTFGPMQRTRRGVALIMFVGKDELMGSIVRNDPF